jgi:hypothetical protein
MWVSTQPLRVKAERREGRAGTAAAAPWSGSPAPQPVAMEVEAEPRLPGGAGSSSGQRGGAETGVVAAGTAAESPCNGASSDPSPPSPELAAEPAPGAGADGGEELSWTESDFDLSAAVSGLLVSSPGAVSVESVESVERGSPIDQLPPSTPTPLSGATFVDDEAAVSGPDEASECVGGMDDAGPNGLLGGGTRSSVVTGTPAADGSLAAQPAPNSASVSAARADIGADEGRAGVEEKDGPRAPPSSMQPFVREAGEVGWLLPEPDEAGEPGPHRPPRPADLT